MKKATGGQRPPVAFSEADCFLAGRIISHTETGMPRLLWAVGLIFSLTTADTSAKMHSTTQ